MTTPLDGWNARTGGPTVELDAMNAIEAVASGDPSEIADQLGPIFKMYGDDLHGFTYALLFWGGWLLQRVDLGERESGNGHDWIAERIHLLDAIENNPPTSAD